MQWIKGFIKGIGWQQALCLLVFVTLSALSGNPYVEKIAIGLGIGSALLVDEPKKKHFAFWCISILMILVFVATWAISFRESPYKYEAGKLIHQSCKAYLGEVGDGYEPIDEDGDGFWAECERHAGGDDSDATRIPDLGTGNIRPSFIDQKTRGCTLAGDTKSFQIFHAGIPGRSASGYVISFSGGRQECDIKHEDRNRPDMSCAFDHIVAKAFEELPAGQFPLSAATILVKGGTENFQFNCKKL